LVAASTSLARFVPGDTAFQYKSSDDPITEADAAVNEVLRRILVQDGEGWLSEETTDDFSRMSHSRVWVVDPLDGTREFVKGIPEWCVSVGLVEDNKAVAGGICNPVTGETFLGSLRSGVMYNGMPVCVSRKQGIAGGVVLASRSEVQRGEWKRFEQAPFTVFPMGSVAYKLARVAAGLADATFTLVPKHEWDVAAGVALVEAAGGFVCTSTKMKLSFNNRLPLLPGLIAGAPGVRWELLNELDNAVRNDCTSNK